MVAHSRDQSAARAAGRLNAPQAARVEDAAQNDKRFPVIKALREAGVLVSAETYQPAVTRACLEAGANILNLTGTDGTEELFRMVAAHDAAVLDPAAHHQS